MSQKVIIIGAGIFGLITAKTYLQLYPNVHLTILEAQSTLGGTWSRDRIYPGLTSMAPEGMFEFSDEPLLVNGTQNENEYIQAVRVAEYLEAYAEKWGVRERVRFGVWVEKVERREEGGWRVRLSGGEVLEAEKLVMATGLTSEPQVPEVMRRERDKSEKPCFHTKDITRQLHEVTAPETKSVVIYGGGKFGADVANIALEHKKQVTWLVRPRSDGGRGMPGIFPAHFPVIGNLVAAMCRRAVYALNPSIHDKDSFSYRFFHSGQSALGTSILRQIHQGQSQSYLNSVKDHPVFKDPDYQMFMPNGNSFWNINAIPIPHKSFHDALLDPTKIEVKLGTITSFSPSTVHLKDGTTLKADAVIAATGWSPTFPLLDLSQRAELGLPCPNDKYPKDKAEHWKTLEDAAEEELVRKFPIFGLSPEDEGGVACTTTPFRLYRHIIPIPTSTDAKRDIAIVGTVQSQANIVTAEVQALWAVAYLENELELPSVEEMERRLAEQTAFMALRYLNYGRRIPCYVFEFVWYHDTLLADLGLPARRRAWKLSDLFSKVRPRDFRGIQEEWAAQRAISKRVY